MLGLGNSVAGGAALEDFKVANVSGLITWLKADTGVTASGSTVASWQDQAGDVTPANNWVSNQSGKQPKLVGSGVDAYIEFDGGDRMYQKIFRWESASDGFDFDFPKDTFDVMNSSGSEGSSTFAVVHLDTANVLNKIFSVSHFADDGTPGAPFGSNRTDIAGTVQLNTGDPSSGTSNDSFTIGGANSSVSAFDTNSDVADELPLDTKILISLEYAGGTNGAVTVRKNATNISLTNATTVTAGKITVGLLGKDFEGRMYEIINFSSKVSSSDRANIESYLIDRHSIS